MDDERTPFWCWRVMRAMTKSPYPPKTRRPSRRARLPYAIISDPPSTFEPTAANWQAMEGAYDRPLGDDDREAIVKLVTNYFHLGQFGRNASFVDDAEKWLAKVQKAAESTQNDLGVFSKVLFPDEQTENSAEFHARYRIKQHLKEQRRWPELKIEYVQNMLKDYLDAIALTAKELETASSWGPIEEIQWGILIIGLTKWFNAIGFLLEPRKVPINPRATSHRPLSRLSTHYS